MNQYINVYKVTITSSGAIDTPPTALVSEGTMQNPVLVALDATNNEEKTAILAIKIASNLYSTIGPTVISFEGDTKDKWQIAAKPDGPFNDTLTINDEIKYTYSDPKLFYVKASASSDEAPGNDDSVKIKVKCRIQKVG